MMPYKVDHKYFEFQFVFYAFFVNIQFQIHSIFYPKIFGSLGQTPLNRDKILSI